MASSCTTTLQFQQNFDRETAVLQFAWTADTDGSFASVSTDDTNYNDFFTMTDMIKGWDLVYAQTDPGATAPTASYDIAVTDANSEDMFGTFLNNRSATATESQFAVVGGSEATRPITGALTLSITNNSVNAATGVVRLHLQRRS